MAYLVCKTNVFEVLGWNYQSQGLQINTFTFFSWPETSITENIFRLSHKVISTTKIIVR
jgi:hypothetical protein